MIDSSPFFSSDYVTARELFRAAAKMLGWEWEAFPFADRGPEGELLTLDVACSSRSPGNPAGPTLILSSGLHGVEGFFGSAVQVALLKRIADGALELPVRCVMLHALNPFGFAWLRRFDSQNIDPNRNFLLPDEEFAGSPPLYTRLDPLINPRYRLNRYDFFRWRAAWLVARFGLRALQQAIAAGQYDFPQGLFFGGHGPCETQQVLAKVLPQWVGGATRVVHLDFHTGLGSRGRWKLLIDYPLTAPQKEQLAHFFGYGNFETFDAPQTAYDARGGLGRWCVHQQFASDYLFACAEFGTYPPLQVLTGLREENQGWYNNGPLTQATLRAKERLVELFCPAADDWRATVIRQSLALIDRAARSLQPNSRSEDAPPVSTD